MNQNQKYYVEKCLFVFFEFYQQNDCLCTKNIFNMFCPSELLSNDDYELFLLFGKSNTLTVHDKYLFEMFFQILALEMELLEKFH